MDPKVELLRAMSSLFESGKYSDLSIRCGHKTYAVHRALLCSRSTFFEAACGGAFREAQSGVIDLSEDDAEAVEHMINYFYKLDYLSTTHYGFQKSSLLQRRTRPQKLDLREVEDPLIATAAALSPASMPSLTHSAESSPVDSLPPASPFSCHAVGSSSSRHGRSQSDQVVTNPSSSLSALSITDSSGRRNSAPPLAPSSTIDSVIAKATTPTLLIHVRVYALADKYDISGLKKLAQQKFSAQVVTEWDSADFPDVIAEVYDTTVENDRGLRDLILQQFRMHPMLSKCTSTLELMDEFPSFADDLAMLGLVSPPPPSPMGLVMSPTMRIGPVSGELNEKLQVDTKMCNAMQGSDWMQEEYLDWFYGS